MTRCKRCGVVLDGRIRRPRLVQLTLDDSTIVGAILCVTHYEETRDRMLQALHESLREPAAVSARGGV